MNGIRQYTTEELMRILGAAQPLPEDAHRMARELLARNTGDKIRGASRDRSALLRMAGNIASGVLADQSNEATTTRQIASAAVTIAVMISKDVDKYLDTEK